MTQFSNFFRRRFLVTATASVFLKGCLSDLPDSVTEIKSSLLLKIWNDHRCTVLMITHDTDETLFLADLLVMMTNGSAATIGEIMDIPFRRPRDRARIMEMPEYYKLRNHALDLLYNRFAHDDVE